MKVLLTKGIKKTIEKINKKITEIESKNSEFDFLEEFYDGSHTYQFISRILTDNKIDYTKLMERDNDDIKIYISNILTYWYNDMEVKEKW